jgi:hypothetical protein
MLRCGEVAMDTSGGSQTEKWMTWIPLSVFIFIVVVALGGWAGFVRTVGDWTSDLLAFVLRWLKEL